MKSFIAACAIAVVLAVIGGFALEGVQQTSTNAFNDTGAKL
jgi:Na+(H+)/acetate symporter ActP